MHIITQIYIQNILKEKIKCNYSMNSVYKNITSGRASSVILLDIFITYVDLDI